MKKNKEATGPRISSVIFVGILCFILGKMLALGSLVSQPATLLNKDPEEGAMKPGTVWYVRGDRAGRTAWQAKEDAWKAGTVDRLSLSEAELNQWSSDRLKVEKAAPSEEGSSWSDRIKINVSPVNFRILDGQVQMLTEVTFADLFEGRSFIYVVVGKFESTPSGVRFVPEKGTLGSAPLGSFPVYREWLYGYMRKQFESAPDVAWLDENFENLESVDVADGQLVLKRRAQG